MIRKRSYSEDESETNAKKLKLKEETDAIEKADDVAVAVVIEGAKELNSVDASPPSIFKLDIDCCEELFEYLPLDDLHSLGQTCKRMYQYTGHYVRDNYKATQFMWSNGNLFVYFNHQNVMVNGFIEFISILRICNKQMNKFAKIATKFKSIKQLRLDLISCRIDCSNLAEILQRCEEIELIKYLGIFIGDLYENVLKFCINLKHLKVIMDGPSENDFDWLLHEYLNLESIDLSQSGPLKLSAKQIKTFFALNKGIRKMSINAECLLDHQQLLLGSDLKLSEISVECFNFILSRGLPELLIELLNKLYERGFYERLSIYHAKYFSFGEIKAPLTVDYFVHQTQISTVNLIGLHMRYENNFNNIVVDNRIQQIRLSTLDTKHILHLIQKFKKLKKIQIDCLIGAKSFDLLTLNMERKKLFGANRVTIYLSRCDYNPRMRMNHCELVKIKCCG